MSVVSYYNNTMRKFFGGGPESEKSPNPEPDQENKWFPARWNTETDSFEGWARRYKRGTEFSVRLPDVVKNYPESVYISVSKSSAAGSDEYQVSFRTGESSWQVLRIPELSKGNRHAIWKFGAHVGERGIEDHVSFDQIVNKTPVDL